MLSTPNEKTTRPLQRPLRTTRGKKAYEEAISDSKKTLEEIWT